MIKKVFHIKTPLWGIKGVGLKLDKNLNDTDIVAVFVDYKNKKGEYWDPHVYMDSVINIKARHDTVKQVKGTTLYMIALSKFTTFMTRKEYAKIYKADEQEGSGTHGPPGGSSPQVA